MFGPFLILPLSWSVYRILTGRARDMLVYLPAAAILTLGVLFSFSRAAWAMVPLACLVILLTLCLQASNNRFRLRLILIALLAVAAVAVGLLILIEIPGIGDFFCSARNSNKAMTPTAWGGLPVTGMAWCLPRSIRSASDRWNSARCSERTRIITG